MPHYIDTTEDPVQPYPYDKARIQNALLNKRAASMNVQRILLEQLAALPGAITRNDDGRDLSRILNEEVKNGEFLDRWIQLNTTL